jgi:ketosteroid isomerase-like protein
MAPRHHDALRRIIKAYVQGDLEPLMVAAADDIVWNTNARPSHFRFGGEFRGRIGVKEGLSLLASEFSLIRYDVREVTGDGDVVWVLSDVIVSEHRTGRRANVTLVNRWQFRDGKVVSCTEFFDSVSALIALGRVDAKSAA